MEGKTFYLTKEKLRELRQEHKKLVAFEHGKMAGEKAPRVLESEDLNPEFVSFQEDVSFLRARIDELEDIFEHCQLIKQPPKEKRHLVDLGATVKVAVNGKDDEFTLVGTLEANPQLGRISNESPVGRALLGKQIGDEVVIPDHENTRYRVKHISYQIS